MHVNFTKEVILKQLFASGSVIMANIHQYSLRLRRIIVLKILLLKGWQLPTSFYLIRSRYTTLHAKINIHFCRIFDKYFLRCRTIANTKILRKYKRFRISNGELLSDFQIQKWNSKICFVYLDRLSVFDRTTFSNNKPNTKSKAQIELSKALLSV